VNRTSLTRSPGRPSEVPIPCLQQPCLMLDDEPVDAPELDRSESEITHEIVSVEIHGRDLR